MHLAFINGTIDVDVPAGLTSDRLFAGDGRISTWPNELPADTEIIDLNGGYLRASFADGHSHPFLAGGEGLGPSIRHLESVEAIAQIIGEWADANPQLEWIVAGSYDATIVASGLFDAEWLDHVDRPVVLRAWDYHTVWCNSKALELAGITSETPDPSFGKIVRRDDGSPMGTLLEAAGSLVLDLVPSLSLPEQLAALTHATATLASHGVTWTQEAWTELEQLEAWCAAARQGLLAVDVDLAFRADPLRWPEQLNELIEARRRCAGIDGLSTETVKFFIDGIIENHTAAMIDTYADACSHGLPNWAADNLGAAIQDVHRADFDIHLHAIGDGGVRTALDAVAALRQEAGGADRRVTLAHAQVIHPDDLGRFAQLGVAVCFQPLWARLDDVMLTLTLPRLGKTRELQYQIGSVLRSGAEITFGSDWPCASPNVLAGIATAVTRQDEGGVPTEGWHPEERISIEEALRAATIAVKVQSRYGETRGAIRVGNSADLLWLPEDPRVIDPAAVSSLPVLGTWRRGVRTH